MIMFNHATSCSQVCLFFGLFQLEKPFEVGQSVHVTVDWERRFDHMQQHTGQHLLTSIAADIETITAKNSSDNAVAIALSRVPKRLFHTFLLLLCLLMMLTC